MAKGKKRVDDMALSTVDKTIPRPRAKKEVDRPNGDDMVIAQPGQTATQEHTMSEQITIQGLEFTVPVRYSEGHTLTAGEASALNQVFHENLRNNFAAKIKKLKEANGEAIDVAALQSDLDTYAEGYAFGVRTAGGPRAVADPVKREAISLAKIAIKAALQRKGKSLKDAGGNEWLAKAAEEAVATRPVFMEQAKERLAQLQDLAADALDG